MRADEIKRQVSTERLLNMLGVKITGQGDKTPICCPVHHEKNPSATFYRQSDSWFCHKCQVGGTIIDLAMQTQHLNFKDACKWLEDKFNLMESVAPGERDKMLKKDTYTYRNEHGEPLYYVDRFESPNGKKKFVQWQNKDGKRVNNIEGVRRVLLNLPAVMAEEEVFLFEGEKKAKALCRIDSSYAATSACMGSGNWMAAYGEFLRDKHLTVCPDNDEAGAKWMESVRESVVGKVASLRIVHMPESFNDFADMVDALGKQIAHDRFLSLLEAAPRVAKGIDVPILSAEERIHKYVKMITAPAFFELDLSRLFPSFRHRVRPSIPGEMIGIIGNTGTGKTALLQNIARTCCKAPCLMFELELSTEKMAERELAMSYGIDSWDVMRQTKEGKQWSTQGLDHIFECSLRSVDLPTMHDMIIKSELKIGAKPQVVFVDYIGLLRGGIGKRYERMSEIAEALRILANETKTIVVLGSQIHRPKDDPNQPVQLHDAKDSGSIEASVSLLLGIWRPELDKLMIEVLKDNNRCSGAIVACDFQGGTYRITESMSTAEDGL